VKNAFPLCNAGILRGFGAFSIIRLALSLVVTKIISRRARLIRLPIYIRNRKAILLGDEFTAGVGLRIEAFGGGPDQPVIVIGKNVQINDYVHIGAVRSVRIGDDVLIASKVFISDHNHGRYSGEGQHTSPNTPPSQRELSAEPVDIGNNVWLGEFVSILPGAKIGDGSVIGSMSVVTGEIPSECMAVGAPARVVKRYCRERRRWERV